MTYNSLSALQNPWDFGRHIRYMFSIFAQNCSSIDVDHKEISLSKETETETLDVLISLNTNPNDMKFLSHIYSNMIYKIPKEFHVTLRAKGFNSN